jgi:hypothetical protein
MSVGMRIVLLALGAVLMVIGIHLWLAAGVMGLWSSVCTVLGFSFLVVGTDEWLHAVRAQRRAAAGVPRAGH